MAIENVNNRQGIILPELGGKNGNDIFIRNIQAQILNKQKEMQELSKSEDMSPEDKMKKRQELRQQITDFSHQLRQYQLEQRKERQQRSTSRDDRLGDAPNKNNAKSQSKAADFSQAGMEAIIAAGSAMKQAQVQGRVATDLNGRAAVLEVEIKLDGARNMDVEKKTEELAEIQEKAQGVLGSQMSKLAEANEEIKDNVKEEQESKGQEKSEVKAEKEGNTLIDIRL